MLVSLVEAVVTSAEVGPDDGRAEQPARPMAARTMPAQIRPFEIIRSTKPNPSVLRTLTTQSHGECK